jgi:glycoprotein endo-alpha-1,2-mannosidase
MKAVIVRCMLILLFLTSPVLAEHLTESQIYFYTWYDNPNTGSLACAGAYIGSGNWRHWNQPFKQGGYTPHPEKGDISSYYWPQRNQYSSFCRTTINQQMDEIKQYGHIGVIIHDWFGYGSAGDQNANAVISSANARGLKVAFVIDSYKISAANREHYGDENGNYCGANGDFRNACTIRVDIEQIVHDYASQDGYWHIQRWTAAYPRPDGAPTATAASRPIIYVFASNKSTKNPYGLSNAEWKNLIGKKRVAHTLPPSNPDSIRHDLDDYSAPAPNDCVVIGMGTSATTMVATLNFDGFHLYDGYSDIYGANQQVEWAKNAKTVNGIFVAAVAPGKHNLGKTNFADRTKTEKLNFGVNSNKWLYDYRWDQVINTVSSWAAIISYNEFHEGTQIEPTVEHTPDSGSTRPSTAVCPPNSCGNSTVYCHYNCDFGVSSDAPTAYLTKTATKAKLFNTGTRP